MAAPLPDVPRLSFRMGSNPIVIPVLPPGGPSKHYLDQIDSVEQTLRQCCQSLLFASPADLLAAQNDLRAVHQFREQLGLLVEAGLNAKVAALKLDERLRALEAHFAPDGMVGTMAAQIAELVAHFRPGGMVSTMSDRITRMDSVQLARLANSRAVRDVEALVPIPHPIGGEPPPDGLFPATVGEMKRLTGPKCDSFFRHYNMPAIRGGETAGRVPIYWIPT